MISHRYRCIHVHIPKCAGTSFEELIWPGHENCGPDELWMGFIDRFHNRYQTGGLQHLLARQIRHAVGTDTFKAYFKFSIVRNPWDRIVSQYIYTMNQRPDLREFAGLSDRATLPEYLDRISKQLHVQWEQQVNFLYDENGELLVDFVGRFEMLDQDAPHILNKLGIFGSLPHELKSQRLHYRDYYTDETRDVVAHMFRDDIETLGYEFDGTFTARIPSQYRAMNDRSSPHSEAVA